MRVDKDDNIWAIDKGSDMIVKFNPEGRVAMVFGRKKEASDEAAPWTRVNPPRPAVDGQFRQPTDVTWDPQGNIFISDGYINSRVAKFDKNGDWVKQWGERGTKPGEFNTPHSIAADAKGTSMWRIAATAASRCSIATATSCARSRSTCRSRRTRPWMGNQPSAQGAAAQSPARPWAICITPGPTQYLYSADAFPGACTS